MYCKNLPLQALPPEAVTGRRFVDGGYTCLLSAFFFPRPFPTCLFSFVRGSDISLPPRILLRRRASCFQPRAFVSCPCPVNVLWVSSQPPHIVSLLECIASTHTSSLGVLSAHRRIAVARVAHCMPSLFFPLSVYFPHSSAWRRGY